MNRRGLLGSLLSLVPAHFAPKQSRGKKKLPVGLIDDNWRYLTPPAVGTDVWLVAKPGIWSDRGGEWGQVILADFYYRRVTLLVEFGPREYRDNGQVRQALLCRCVDLKREPLYATPEAAIKQKFEDVYHGDDTVVTSDVYVNKCYGF